MGVRRDYDAVAEMIWSAGEHIVEHVAAGDDVLDVTYGTGNAAVAAAQRGARVLGLDPTPELFVAGRARAAAAGVEIECVEGDAEALLFDAESCDVVLSAFGCISVRLRLHVRAEPRDRRGGARASPQETGALAYAGEYLVVAGRKGAGSG